MFVRNFFAPRILRAPEDDAGYEYEDLSDESEELPDPDSDLGDEADEGGDGEGDADQLGQSHVGDDDGSEEDAREVRRPSRAQARVETALREAREAKAELERLRTERQQADFQRQQRETAAQEAERLALMDPEERYEYRARQLEAKLDQRLQAIQFQSDDRADKTAFDALVSRSPIAAKLADKVEDALREMRRNGTTAPRETVLKYLIGENAIANAGRAKGKATRTAALNKAKQVGRPTGGRSDISSGSPRSGDDRSKRAARLADISI